MKFHKRPATHVGMVQLKVSNLRESARFYTDIIGLSILKESDSEVSFSTNGEDVLLTLVEPTGAQVKREQTTGLYHFALLLPRRSDLAQVTRHYVEKGIRFGSGDHLVSEALYLSDLDGNGIEIYVDRDSKDWHWENGEVAMTTDPVDYESLLKEKSTSNWQGLPKETVMGHVHLQVKDLEENEQFYVDGLGFSVVNRYGKAALFISDYDYHHHIAFNVWAGPHIRHAKKYETGIAAYTIVFPNEEKRQEKIKSLNYIGKSVLEEDGNYYTYDPSHTKIWLLIR